MGTSRGVEVQGYEGERGAIMSRSLNAAWIVGSTLGVRYVVVCLSSYIWTKISCSSDLTGCIVTQIVYLRNHGQGRR